jgi:hypothetical protein
MADQRYLNVLAESYKNALSWETRKQILSIMTDLASYSVISSFISGILLNTDTRQQIYIVCSSVAVFQFLPKHPFVSE